MRGFRLTRVRGVPCAGERLGIGDHGYEPERVLTAQLRLPDARYRTDDQRRPFWDDLLGRVQSLPLVEQVASISHLPNSNSGPSQVFLIEGRPQPPDGQWPLASSRVSSPGYFATLQIPLHRGRDFTAHDDEDAPPVAIISRLMAGRSWPDEDPIGQRLRFSAPGTDDPWIEVVGVSGDVVHQWFSERGEPTVYRPYDQAPRRRSRPWCAGPSPPSTPNSRSFALSRCRSSCGKA